MSRRAAARALPLLLLLASASLAGARGLEDEGAASDAFACGEGISRHGADDGPSRPRATEVWIEHEGRCEFHTIYVVAYATKLNEAFCVTAASAAEHGYADPPPHPF